VSINKKIWGTASYGDAKFNIIFVVFFTILLAAACCLHIYEDNLNGPPIRSDGFGYHSYLSSIFIDGDLSFHSALTTVSDDDLASKAYGLGPHPITGKIFTKYLPGTALLATPFFIAADVFAKLYEFPRTGYSTPYQVANIVSGIFYLCIGMLAIYTNLRRKYPSQIAGMVLLLVTFATNVFHYATYDGSFSHIYSFATISIYILLLDQYRNSSPSRDTYYLIGLGITIGLIAMIRLPNAILGILALGFVVEKNLQLENKIHLFKQLAIFGIAAFLTTMPLFAYWYRTSGSFIFNSYAAFPLKNGKLEGFNWTKPEIFKFLFSIDRGLFFWSPVTLLGFLGLPSLFKRDLVFPGLITLVLSIHIYICSSWWIWSFGASFGCRPFVDLMPLFSVPLATSIVTIRKKWGVGWSWVLTVCFVAINSMLMYSYWHSYIPYTGTTLKTFEDLPLNFGIEY
jgi:putative effector of murein hydrolase LrgA (UPF0299 family)